MKLEHEAKLDRNEMSMLRWVYDFNLEDKKNLRLGNYWDWSQSACQLREVDYSCLDMLYVKMMQTGSSIVLRWRLREPMETEGSQSPS